MMDNFGILSYWLIHENLSISLILRIVNACTILCQHIHFFHPHLWCHVSKLHVFFFVILFLICFLRIKSLEWDIDDKSVSKKVLLERKSESFASLISKCINLWCRVNSYILRCCVATYIAIGTWWCFLTLSFQCTSVVKAINWRHVLCFFITFCN